MTDRQATVLGCSAALVSAALAILGLAFFGDLAVQVFRAVAQ